jgi:myo-inositol 2-dehydrogenase/D-chiro-inositol 1-dehydrogenase
MKSPIGVGIIGTGGMGGRHARNLAMRVADAHVAAVMDLERARAEAVAAECGGARAHGEPAALIANPEVEAVVIASPDATHAALALACLEAGKPVLCEKPLAASLAEAERVVLAEAALGRRLVQVGFMRVYDPAHLAVKQVVERGELGPPVLFQGFHGNMDGRGSRTVEEVMFNSAVHDIHSARWLTGREVESVFARTLPGGTGASDSCRLAAIQLTLDGGALAVIVMNPDSGYGYEVQVEGTGEVGSVRGAEGPHPLVRRAGTRGQAVEPDWLARFDEAYVAEMGAWIGSLLAGRPDGPSAWDGYVSLAVADACLRSARSGAPQAVRLIERPALYGSGG